MMISQTKILTFVKSSIFCQVLLFKFCSHCKMATPNAVKIIRIPPLPSIREILKLYNLTALRQLSQNFLLDPGLNNKIVKCCGSIKGAEVCEVGPGPGNITRSILMKGARKIHVIEKDSRFLPSLQMLNEATDGMVNIIPGDVLHFDMHNLFEESRRKAWNDIPPNIHLIGNLPFNIATPLIIRWLRAISLKNSAWSYGRVRMTLTFQKEVAERIESPILTTSRCRLSVMCQNWCEVQMKLLIPGKAFLPKPKVDVGVVHFVPRVQPIIPLPFELVEKVVRSIFAFRQKHVIRGLQTLFPSQSDEQMALKLLENAGLTRSMRAFQLSNEEIGQLCIGYQNIIEENPSLKRYHRSSVDQDWLSKERESEIEAKKFKESALLDDFY